MAKTKTSDRVEFRDESSLHHYRTEIPNILFEMGLDSYEFKAYCVFKKTAGDGGSCFKANAVLCEEIGCKKPKLIEIKKSLKKKGLIKISKKKSKHGGSAPDTITIVDIWGENMKRMMAKKEEKTLSSLTKNEMGGGNLGLPGGVIQDYQGGNLGLPPIRRTLEEEPNKEEERRRCDVRGKPSTSLNASVQPAAPSEYPSPSAQGIAAVFSSSKEESKWPRKTGPREADKPPTVLCKPGKLKNPPPQEGTSEGYEPNKHTSLKSPKRSVTTPPPCVAPTPPQCAYECLKGVLIPESDKLQITVAYDEDQVNHAVAWATHPLTVVKKGLAAAIVWACQSRPKMPCEAVDSAEVAKLYAQKHDGLKHGKCRVEAFNTYVEVTHSEGNIRDSSIGYEEPAFMKKFTDLLARCGITPLEV